MVSQSSVSFQGAPTRTGLPILAIGLGIGIAAIN